MTFQMRYSKQVLQVNRKEHDKAFIWTASCSQVIPSDSGNWNSWGKIHVSEVELYFLTELILFQTYICYVSSAFIRQLLVSPSLYFKSFTVLPCPVFAECLFRLSTATI